MITEPLRYKCAAKIVCRYWDRMAGDRQQAWEQRAASLISQNLPGQLYTVPGKSHTIMILHLYSTNNIYYCMLLRVVFFDEYDWLFGFDSSHTANHNHQNK